MNIEVAIMLENMFIVLLDKFHRKDEAWDKLIEFIAVDNHAKWFFEVDHKFEWLWQDKGFMTRFMKVYDAELIRSDRHDHLGELYHKKISRSPQSRFTIHSKQSQHPVYINIGTCVNLMKLSKERPKDTFYGVESDLRGYRITITNMALFNIKANILNADPNKQCINRNIQEGRENWKQANNWNPNPSQLNPKTAQQ